LTAARSLIGNIRTILLLLFCWTVPLIAGEGGESRLSPGEARLHFFQDFSQTFKQDLSATAVAGQRKSTGLAVVYSFLLPGMGELYSSDFSSGKYFLIGEGALWITFGIFDGRGNALQRDARTYAVSRAGINANGKNDQFYVDIGNFNSIEEYNEKKLQDREPQKLYDAAAGYGWRWTSDADRATYRNQRVASDRAFENGKFVLAAVLVNHLASAINAARAAVVHNRALETALKDVELSASVIRSERGPQGILLSLKKGF
jgi:hypothetical protein